MDKRRGDLKRTGNTTGRSREQVRGSIVVSISACHAEDPGSIPGRGATCTHPSKQWGFIGYQARAKKMRTYVSGFAR